MNRPLWDQWWREERSGAMDSRSFAQAMEQWVYDGQHSGGTEPASWIEFTALNAVRMRRVAKTIKMPESLMGSGIFLSFSRKLNPVVGPKKRYSPLEVTAWIEAFPANDQR